MESMASLLSGLLLAVLLLPVGFAGLSWLTRGRAAVPLAALHLGLVAGLVMLLYGPLLERGYTNSDRSLGLTSAQPSFLPLAVPGDPGLDPKDPDVMSGKTSWSLLSFPSGANSATPADIQLYLGVDGLSVWLLLLTSLMTFIALLISPSQITENYGGYTGWIFLLEFAALGCFSAFDIVLFYVFFELTLIPSFFLIGRWGVGRARRDAARLFFLYTLLGSLLTLVGIVGIVLTNPMPLNPSSPSQPVMRQINRTVEGQIVFPKAGGLTWSIPELMQNVSTWSWSSQIRLETAQAQLTVAQSRVSTVAGSPIPADPAARAARLTALQTAEEQVREAEQAIKLAEREKETRRWTQTVLFLALLAGFAVKIPILPFHTWLPTAYQEAPLPVTMLFSAVLAKLGT